MKFLSVVVLITVALLTQESEAFWRGGFGLGLGRFGWGGFGGFGGFGMPLVIPVPVPFASPVVSPVVSPIVNPVGVGLGGLGFVGKRQAGSYGSNHVDSESSRVESESEVPVVQPVVQPDVQPVVQPVVVPVVQPVVVPEVANSSFQPFRPVSSVAVDRVDSEVFNSVNETGIFGFDNETEVENGTRIIQQRGLHSLKVNHKASKPIKRFLLAPIAPVIAVRRILPIRPVVAIIGKRAIFNETENITVCSLSSKSSVFRCEGQQFECSVVANLTALGSFEQKGDNYRMLPEGLFSFNSTSKVEVDRVEIISWKDDSELNDYSFVIGGQKVLLSLYNSERVQDIGFRFRDQQCWKSYVDFLRVSGPVNVRLVLDITRV